ncbi:hypothetical protein [Sphingopyxis kveilinensis]|uniref:hypothetical protein n=1 Tax=Sphingopyxis kveilinensis TaxID=3114367 RepID=UPI0030D03D2A
MERQFVNANFKYIRVIPLDNGVTWSIEQICNKISTTYRALNLNCVVIVWLDREGRDETAEQIREQIYQALINLGAEPQNIRIMVCDRMTENVILADEQVISDLFQLEAYEYAHEGKNGKHILKEFYKSHNINYKEMKEGVALLKRIRLDRASQKSASVARFRADWNGDCWWFA